MKECPSLKRSRPVNNCLPALVFFGVGTNLLLFPNLFKERIVFLNVTRIEHGFNARSIE